MTLLYVVNLIGAFALLFVPVWFSLRVLRLPMINPFSIILAISMPVHLLKLYAGPALLIDGGIFDGAYQFALLMGNVLIVAQAFSLVFFYRLFALVHTERYLPFRRIVLNRSDLRRAEFMFVLGYLASIYLLASAEFGVLNWLENPRVGYQFYRTGQGHWYALAVSMLAVAMVLAGFADPRPRKIIRNGLFYLALGYLLGSKGMLLAIFYMTLISLWFVRWQHLKTLILWGSPPILLLLVWNLYLSIDGFELQSIVSYFDHYKNAAAYYREYLTGSLPLFNGKIAETSLWAYAPRAIWPEKPHVYGILHVNEIFYPGQAELTHTPAFGGAVEQFADFGVVGVIIYGLLNTQSMSTALLSYLIFRHPGIDLQRITLASVLLIIVQFSPGFGTFLPGVFYVILLLLVATVIRVFRFRR